MYVKICLVVPQKNKEISELQKFIGTVNADIYIFPEGFLHNESLSKAMEISAENRKFIISGYQEKAQDYILEKALVIDEGKIIGEYTKCILTKGECRKGKKGGNAIYCIDTKYGKIGIPICYELHFPEVARIMALDAPVMLINIIGTGMYHEAQYAQWTALAKARAIENELFVAGCSHYNGEIPLAFAYSPKGKALIEEKSHYGQIVINIDLSVSHKKEIDYLSDRKPKLFQRISEQTKN